MWFFCAGNGVGKPHGYNNCCGVDTAACNEIAFNREEDAGNRVAAIWRNSSHRLEAVVSLPIYYEKKYF